MSCPPTFVTESPFVRRVRRPGARTRLFCFPHAGAGLSAYREWCDLVPADVELVAIQLPGREDRVREKPFTRAEPMIRSVTQALRPYLDLPFTFFGHSGGALLAYETARALTRRRSATPVRLYLSGQAAPGVGPNVTLHTLPDDEFQLAVRALGGTDDEVWSDDGAVRDLIPVLRADFTVWESYRFPQGPSFDVPLEVLGGDHDDRTSPLMLDAWREWTTDAVRVHMFPGDHFFINQARPRIVQLITEGLSARGVPGSASARRPARRENNDRHTEAAGRG